MAGVAKAGDHDVTTNALINAYRVAPESRQWPGGVEVMAGFESFFLVRLNLNHHIQNHKLDHTPHD